MNEENEEKASPVFNAEYIMNQMEYGVRKEGMKPLPESPSKAEIKSAAKEKSRTVKTNDKGYEELFFRNPGSNARNGKSVYINPEFHERLSRIVQVIGDDKLSIYAYLNNVLEYHFQEFGEEITTSFNEKYKPIL
ncbi:DUF3408 domain-containing protein [Pedobacter sp. ISL-68]|uniref:DUF3408 domain-containing protein n=1 Tax=unclassified Pedobacter TaxID=2628915 RepID=UPI001BEBA0BE|nr:MULTISPECIES: DUF3408 domain-containing protein [unclassified Pedobacter]MBT2559806.1 DUF3408 domain-containing protein [Pedobacter sp. ISL-64]MBT2592111.1 DUF3408 domain-containing protein [Pedobacter sp. ISL-68]